MSVLLRAWPWRKRIWRVPFPWGQSGRPKLSGLTKLTTQRLTFDEEHDHKWYYEGQAAVFLHQNGKSDYVAQAD